MNTAWDNSRYDGATTNANLIDDEARRLGVQIADLFMQGGRKIGGNTPPAASTTNNDDGKTCVGWETQTFQNDQGYHTLLWDFAGTTAILRAYGLSHATKPGWIEPQGAAKFVGVNITSGLDPGHLHTQGGCIGGRSGILSTGYVKPGTFRWAKGAGEGTQTVRALYASVATPPTGGSLVIEVRKTSGAPAVGVNPYDNAVATTVIGTITITTGNFSAETTGLSVALTDGDLILLNITTVTGSPAELMVNAVIEG